MALTNSQKLGLVRGAKDNNYKGDYIKLFNEAEKDGAFNKPPTLKPLVQDPTISPVPITGSESFDLDVKSLLIDKTPHRFNQVNSFITSDHSVKPNNKAILRFLSDPAYLPKPDISKMSNGGVKKYPDGGEQHVEENEILKTNQTVDQWNKQYVQSANYKDMLTRSGGKESDIQHRIDSVMKFNPEKDVTYDVNNPHLGQMYNDASFDSSGRRIDMGSNFHTGTDKINYNPLLKKGHGLSDTTLGGSNWDGVSSHEQGHLIGEYGLNKKTTKALKNIAKENDQFIREFSRNATSTKKEQKASYEHAKDPEEMRANLTQLRFQLENSGFYKSTEGDVNKRPFTMNDLKDIMIIDENGEFNGYKPGYNNELLETVHPNDIVWMMNNIAKAPIQDDLPKGVQRAADGGMNKYSHGGPESEHTSTFNYNVNLQNFLKVDPDGDIGPNTSKAILNYSNKNITNLPVYNSEYKKGGIKCKSGSCSEITTNTLQLLYPHLQRDEFNPEDSWYRAHQIISEGGQNIWSQSTNKNTDYSKKIDSAPIEVWNKLQVGDIVSMDGNSDYYGSYRDKKSKVSNSLVGNTGSSHTGFIIGKDPETGIPLVMHGAGNEMRVSPINNIALSNKYKINNISRPKALIGKGNDYNFKQLSMFLDKPENNIHTELQFSPTYLQSLSKNEAYMADFFTKFLNGNLQKEQVGPNVEYTPKDTKQLINDKRNFLNNTLLLRDVGVVDENPYVDKKYMSPIDEISNITGYNKDEVIKAAMITYGIYKNETGEIGVGSGAHLGRGKEFVKGKLTSLATLSNSALDKLSNFSNSTLGTDINPTTIDVQEASKGILRIKYNMNAKTLEGRPTRVGDWWGDMGINRAGDLVLENDSENSLITGRPGKEGMANSFAAGTMLTLSYYEEIRRKKDYDPETDTYKGVPIDYVVATMHTGKNLNAQAGNGKTILQNLQSGNRDYANAVIESISNLSYTRTEVLAGDEYKTAIKNKTKTEITETNLTPFKNTVEFINKKQK
jgi:hypothetical protein